MFANIRELQPRSAGGAGGMTMTERVKQQLDEIVEKMPEQFNYVEILDKVEDRSPYVNVFLQEIERMIALLKIISSSLAELELGLKGDLTISAAMEVLMNSLFDGKVPGTWEVAAWPSLRLLASWLGDLQRRCQKLQEWTADLQLPKAPPTPRAQACAHAWAHSSSCLPVPRKDGLPPALALRIRVQSPGASRVPSSVCVASLLLLLLRQPLSSG